MKMTSKKIIDAALVDNASAFKQHVETELETRMSNALHQKKLEISVSSLSVEPEQDSAPVDSSE